MNTRRMGGSPRIETALYTFSVIFPPSSSLYRTKSLLGQRWNRQTNQQSPLLLSQVWCHAHTQIHCQYSLFAFPFPFPFVCISIPIPFCFHSQSHSLLFPVPFLFPFVSTPFTSISCVEPQSQVPLPSTPNWRASWHSRPQDGPGTIGLRSDRDRQTDIK